MKMAFGEKLLITTVVISLTNYFSAAFIKKPLPEDAYLNFTELGVKYGHPVKQYDVTTEDGYVLTLFNLPGSGPPILLIHGITDSADTYIIRGNISLAITLANAKYDVWVGNTRGNKYALKHTTLKSNKHKEFWDFSFHEGGKYDLPAMIDFVLSATGKERLTTIGHSQGTTMHFAMGSERPEYNNKINLFIALAPVAFLNHIEPPLSTLVSLGHTLNTIFNTLGLEELYKDDSPVEKFIQFICSQGILSYKLCAQGVFFSFGGSDPDNLEPEFFPVIMKHYPTSTSRKSGLHYVQVAQRKAFAKYDYGFVRNLAEYRQSIPPDYDLNKVNMSVALIAAKNDGFSKLKDVDMLNEKLPNVVKYNIVKPENWNHLDYVWGRYMPQHLYPQIFGLLKKYNRSS